MALNQERIYPTPLLQGTPDEIAMERGDRMARRMALTDRASLRMLSAEEAEVLDVLTARLIPGARDARVVRYIDSLLAVGSAPIEGPPAPLEMYRTGIALVQRHAMRKFGNPVQALDDAECDEILWDMLEGAMDGFELFSPLTFFRILRRDTAEGMARDLV